MPDLVAALENIV